MKTPILYSPFGVKCIQNKFIYVNEYFLDCSLETDNTTFETDAAMYNKMDETIKNLIKTDHTDYDYYSFYRENGKYNKLIKLQITTDNKGHFTTAFFDESKKNIEIDELNISNYLKKGSKFQCLIECSKVWYSTNTKKMGTNWNILQIKFENPKPKVVVDYNANLFLD